MLNFEDFLVSEARQRKVKGGIPKKFASRDDYLISLAKTAAENYVSRDIHHQISYQRRMQTKVYNWLSAEYPDDPRLVRELHEDWLRLFWKNVKNLGVKTPQYE